jgi:hypothetical protein
MHLCEITVVSNWMRETTVLHLPWFRVNKRWVIVHQSLFDERIQLGVQPYKSA